MSRTGQLLKAVLLATVILSALAGLAFAEAAALDSRSSDPGSAPLVLRGSTDAAEQEASAPNDGAPAVLRGSRRAVAQPPAAANACPAGLEYDLNYGCAWPGLAYAPDYGYWPDFGYWPWGFGTFDGGRRRGSRRFFAHADRRGRVFRLARPTPGFTHTAGFGHGFARVAQFRH